ncbi:MAG: radical SAM protein [Ignavibacteriales bacterium]|nr:radical SAM protein [Ignavibacteriales bacterium]
MQQQYALGEVLEPAGSFNDGDTATSHGIRELDVTLIRATNYTDDGYPIKMKVCVIRSNTLTQMATLTRDIVNDLFFAGIRVNVRTVDEAYENVPRKEIVKRSKERGVRAIVMLVGVQSNQFPRAQDVASWFLPYDIPVLIGGFHVSGMLAMIGETDDLKKAESKGIVLVAGEVENGRLPAVLKDVIRGNPKPLYNFLSPTPDITNLPIPRLTRADFKKSASRFATIDTGRGCVFNCDFCTIINVQGRTMRCRDPKQVGEFVRQSYHEAGVTHCFFTDDNIARNPRWRELFEVLINLRERENIPFTFMMQSDLAAMRMPGRDFFPLAARAGCNQVFLGVESVNKDNLRAQTKFQNQVNHYKELVDHCHSLGITCHAGYILGLPFDTPETIKQDIAVLQGMGFDSASFYILSPLPGSKDHQVWWNEGRWMHEDFNTYDSAHVAVKPDRMTREELQQAWHDAWEQFYSTEHMANVLKVWRHDRWHYWDRMSFFAWYLYASRIERLHPMNCGFWTVRYRDDRRPGFPKEALVPFWWKRLVSAGKRLRHIMGLYFQLQDVWLRSRPKPRTEEALLELIASARKDIADWRDLRARELVGYYRNLQQRVPEIHIPTIPRAWLMKKNPFKRVYTRSYFQNIWQNWYKHLWNPVKWVEIWTFEVVNAVRFFIDFMNKEKTPQKVL